MQIHFSHNQNFAPDWVASAIFYQIFPDRFAKSDSVTVPGRFASWNAKPSYHNCMGGNLRGVTEKLGYLQELGVTALYFCPIFTSASNHRYHTHNYFEIDPILGTMDDFQGLLEAAHSKGIKVILDGVFNHCSRGFYQFNTLLEMGEESPFKEWFHVYHFPIKPYSKTKEVEYACWWNNKALPKFNTSNSEVREFIFEVAEYWLRQGIDGWRLDVPNEIDDDTFWQEFRLRVKRVNPEAYIVGEIWNNPDRWLRGDQFDAVMNYRVRQVIINLFFIIPKEDQSSLGSKISIELFMRLLSTAMSANEIHSQMNLLGSHDTHRILTHAKGNIDKVKQCFALMFFLPGAPCIYYGDEVGIEGGQDPECRKSFCWDRSTWNHELLEFVQMLIRLRKESLALTQGDLFVQFSGSILEIKRVYNQSRIKVSLDLNPGSNYIDIQKGAL